MNAITEDTSNNIFIHTHGTIQLLRMFALQTAKIHHIISFSSAINQFICHKLGIISS